MCKGGGAFPKRSLGEISEVILFPHIHGEPGTGSFTLSYGLITRAALSGDEN